MRLAGIACTGVLGWYRGTQSEGQHIASIMRQKTDIKRHAYSLAFSVRLTATGKHIFGVQGSGWTVKSTDTLLKIHPGAINPRDSWSTCLFFQRFSIVFFAQPITFLKDGLLFVRTGGKKKRILGYKQSCLGQHGQKLRLWRHGEN